MRSATELKARIVETVNPVKEGVRLNAIRATKRGDVIIDALSQGDLDRVLGNEVLKEAGLTFKTPGMRKPLVIICDVPVKMSEDEGKLAMIQQNHELFRDMSPQEVKEETKLLFKTGKRD